ncbi:hypothetical protein ACFQY0_20635 [Haloferula chungangensis]|uniref:Uncharacterized protein n=1 Tax=Haloferula chungangensis TaxID=1048331 RepID=A0ABW2LCS2_9BACT
MKTGRALVYAVVLLSPISSCLADELIGSGMGSLKRGGVLFTLSQIASNVSNGETVDHAFRVIISSGFSLEDLVVIQYKDGKNDMFWRDGLYKNVRFGAVTEAQFEKRHDSTVAKAIIAELHKEETWAFNQRFTGEAMEDGRVVMYAKILKSGETLFRAHRGNADDKYPQVNKLCGLAEEFWEELRSE